MKAKRIILMVLVIALVLSVAAPVSAATIIDPSLYPYPYVTTTMYATSNLNVRTGPSTRYSVVGVLAKGQSVGVIDHTGSWYMIDYFGTVAFASGKYLTTSYCPIPVPVPVPDPYYAGWMIATGNVNVRTGPSTSYAKLGYISRGTTIYATGMTGNWYQVDYCGQTAYISGRYLSPVYYWTY